MRVALYVPHKISYLRHVTDREVSKTWGTYVAPMEAAIIRANNELSSAVADYNGGDRRKLDEIKELPPIRLVSSVSNTPRSFPCWGPLFMIPLYIA